MSQFHALPACPNVERLRKPMQAIEDALLKRAKVKPPAEVVAIRGRKGRQTR